MDMFKGSMKRYDMWYNVNELVYPRHETRHITKYKAEIDIA